MPGKHCNCSIAIINDQLAGLRRHFAVVRQNINAITPGRTEANHAFGRRDAQFIQLIIVHDADGQAADRNLEVDLLIIHLNKLKFAIARQPESA